jgi:hypothetical protein
MPFSMHKIIRHASVRSLYQRPRRLQVRVDVVGPACETPQVWRGGQLRGGQLRCGQLRGGQLRGGQLRGGQLQGDRLRAVPPPAG